ncbi:phasin family protein [Effusibacillus lacus]|uniref:ATP synthase subunit B n=1 Tax=Effusibacillus lacus TaxID=1348429 RepID=A0A292YFX7_9BACL|nr:polyhydroxyalkanoate synthesis regulator phasin [Effusibacillus lacus]GAX89167.1 ATP synthase subunit B [Effusibacillus lacus]
MIDLIKKGLALGIGLAVTSKEQVEKVVDEMVKKGEMSQEESKEVISRLIQRGEEEQRELKRMMREEIKQILAELNIATKEDINRLDRRIQNLENQEQ